MYHRVHLGRGDIPFYEVIHMRHLLQFLIRHNHWFLFLLLEGLCLLLVVRFNRYQEGIFFTAASGVTGAVNNWYSETTHYFGLADENEALVLENLALRERLKQIESAEANTTLIDSLQEQSVYRLMQLEDTLISARVIRNSLSKMHNYMTINKGRLDGVRPEMGVVGGQGVVGVVYGVSDHYSLVLSVLNADSHLSCMVKNSSYFGFLDWSGGRTDIATLKDLPLHSQVNVGDTVVTSGYSTMFPPEVPVGTVEEVTRSEDQKSFELSLKLFTNFSTVKHVAVVSLYQAEEIKKLQVK